MKIFVTGIGTDVGKTIVSAVLVEALEADYWKPIQTGLERDTERVRGLISNSTSVLHPEGCHLKTPCSPNIAADLENVAIDFEMPTTSNTLIIEGCGGSMVPISHSKMCLDCFTDCLWIIVSRHYLGSINHTLLTAEALRERVPILGIIFNGWQEHLPQVEETILKFSQLPCLGRLPDVEINRATITKYACLWKPQLQKTLLKGTSFASGIPILNN